MLVQENMGDTMLVKKRPVSINEMNLKSIQRLDPCAVAIIDKSVHAALYQFDKCKTQWVKSAIEGPLFLYRRADMPLHSLLIANRQSLEDHIEPIAPPLRFFLETPYLFMNTQEGDIRGFWFYDEDDCTRLYKLLVKLVSESNPSTSATVNDSKRAVSANSQNGFGAHSNTATGRDSRCKKLDEMPALLQQLLSKQTTTKLPDVPTRGALSADQFERQLLLRGAWGEGTVVSTEKSCAKITEKCASASEGDEKNDILTNLVNNLSLCAAKTSSSLKVVEKHRSKSRNKHDGMSEDNSQVVSLTKDQLLVALKHLLKDDSFVTRLHCAYLESINTRLGLRD
ncbi:Dcp1-like decapping family protein [Brugia malayi]|uniref:BMA-DCAP-1 n=2 Tax=Brugia malayi TaxID=6279 RepID=A0A0K0JPX4_BRUMA|nr:Dcp1-like decapping family protein [Brugia malayi]CRZ23415.1 BMA-DCAP-1 [Brugia malayi]VIO87559.1 Dcp1-like decapping family protein [Brugia malayi]